MLVAQREPVAIAIERDAEVSVVVLTARPSLRVQRPRPRVDVLAVGLRVDRGDVGAELLEHRRTDAIAAPWRAVDDDRMPSSVRSLGNDALQYTT